MSRRRVYLAIALTTVAPTARAADPAAPQASLNPLRALDKQDLKAFVEAPLFDPARRLPAVFAPAVVPIAIPIDTIEPPPNVHLLGIVHGAKDVALVRGADNKTLILSSGDLVGGWDVAVLPPNNIRLSKGRRAFDYAIFASNGASSGPVPGPPSSPPTAAIVDDRAR